MAFRLHGLRPHLFAHGGQALRQDVLVAGFAPEEPHNEGRRFHVVRQRRRRGDRVPHQGLQADVGTVPRRGDRVNVGKLIKQGDILRGGDSLY